MISYEDNTNVTFVRPLGKGAVLGYGIVSNFALLFRDNSSVFTFPAPVLVGGPSTVSFYARFNTFVANSKIVTFGTGLT